MYEIRHHPAKLLALKMIAEFKLPRLVLKELAPYVREGIFTRSWVEKQSSDAKRARWCRPIIARYREEYFCEHKPSDMREILDRALNRTPA